MPEAAFGFTRRPFYDERRQFIASLERLGIRLWLSEGQLRYQAPKNVLTSKLRVELVARNPKSSTF